MKAIIKTWIFSVMMLFVALTAQAEGENNVGSIAINGLEVGGKYTREQIFAALGGQPDQIVQGIEYPTFFEYRYGNDRFYQMDDEFYGGDFSTSQVTVSEGIKIGDNVEDVNKLNGACYSGDFDESRYAGVVKWRPSKDPKWEWLIVEFYYDAQGNITRINIGVFFI